MRKQISMIRRSALYLLMILLLLFGSLTVRAEESEETQEPEADYETFIEAIHLGQTHTWTPFVNYPGLPVTYASDDTSVLTVSGDGTITPVREGAATVSASTPATDTLDQCEIEMYLYVLPKEDGLYLTDMTCHFYYQGNTYEPGELPVEVERSLCLTQPDLKKYLTEYLFPVQSTLSPDEAALNAILNFGSQYFSKVSLFDSYGSSCESGKTDWMQLLLRKEGLCAYNASLLCWLMHLGGLPAMQMDSPVTEQRAHSWNLIEHDGYYYPLEEYHFLHKPWERYVIPPLSLKTAAYFPGNITQETAVHFPKEGILDNDMMIQDMGRDLSAACPVLMYEQNEDGTFRVWFDEIRKGHIPAWSDGTPVSLDEITYKNMETDVDNNQYNEEAKPLFDEANALLHEEIAPLFER